MSPYYDRDGITIYHADCADVLPTIDPADVALVLTDPPYGISVLTDHSKRAWKRSRNSGSWDWKGKIHAAVIGDDEPFDPSPLLAYKRLVLWGANNYADSLPRSTSWLVWNRLAGPDTTADAELAWTNLGGTVRMFNHMWSGYRRDTEVGWHVHPTQKPVALMRWVLDRWTNPGDLILDPYMGSGPVAQACHEMGRRYIGVEIVENYCRIAVDRLAQGVLAL